MNETTLSRLHNESLLMTESRCLHNAYRITKQPTVTAKVNIDTFLLLLSVHVYLTVYWIVYFKVAKNSDIPCVCELIN